MKHCLTILFIIYFLCCADTASARVDEQPVKVNVYNNYAGLQAGLFIIKNKEHHFPWLRTLGANYTRRIHKNWYIEATYQMWLPEELRLFGIDHYSIERGVDGTPYRIGELVESEYYKMIDLSGLYNILGTSRKHTLLTGIGVTRYWGHNYYINGISPYHPSSYTKGEMVREAFWGVCPQISYRYTFLKNRISVGLTLKHRYFINTKMSTERNYLMTLGYNF